MGLHNRYPRYFYKRGNLFNTYLGHTDDRGQAAPSETSPRRGSAKPPLPSRKPTARSRLCRFANDHMTTGERVRFLELLARDAGVTIRPGRRPVWVELELFVADHVSEPRAARFLAVLRERQQAGRSLIRY